MYKRQVFIYGYFFQKFFTIVVPVLLVGSAPVGVMIDDSAWGLYTMMVVAFIVICFLNKYAWRVALLKYESASS